MPRSAESTAREAVRARSKRKRAGRRADSEQGCLTGHPAFGNLVPAFELGDMPEGGGYPHGTVEKMAELMGVADLASVVHLCSGSVRAPLTFDWRPPQGRLGCPDAAPATGRPAAPFLRWHDHQADVVECPHTPPHPREPGSNCAVVGDVRRLPILTGSVQFVMADPPYDQDYAEELWRLGKVYPTPIVLLRECARILRPGGKVALLHHIVPIMPTTGGKKPKALLERIATYGVSTGPGYRLRSLTIAQRADVGATLFDL